MEFRKNINGQILEIQLLGKFTFSDNGNFRSLISEFGANNITKVVLNMEQTEFVDSAALGMLLLAKEYAEKNNITISLKSPNGQPKKVLEVSSFGELFSIE